MMRIYNLQAIEQMDAPLKTGPAKPDSGPRILIVEDDESLQKILRRIITKTSKTAVVDWASTAPDAVTLLEKSHDFHAKKYDLVLCDLYLPDMQMGTSVWKRGKEIEKTSFAFMSSVKPESYLGLFGDPRNAPPLLRKPFRIEDCQIFLKLMLAA